MQILTPSIVFFSRLGSGRIEARHSDVVALMRDFTPLAPAFCFPTR